MHARRLLALSGSIGFMSLMLAPELLAQSAPLPLEPETEADAVVTFSTEPTGSSISLDGKPLKGRTPITIRLPAGAATVTFQSPREGYKPVSATYSWHSGESLRIEVSLPKAFGYLHVNTTRQWSRIELDGRAFAARAAPWQRVQAGAHLVLAFDGRYLGFAKIRISEGARATVDLTWRKITPDPVLFSLMQTTKTQIGSADYANLNPPRSVDVQAFWIEKNEVSVREYRDCVQARRCSPPISGERCNWNVPGRDDHPVNCVSAVQAVEYAHWFSEKDDFVHRLPTSLEWERAATGTGTRLYPWGMEPAAGRCNICDRSCPWRWRDASVDDHWPETAPIGLFKTCTSPERVYDLVGNVAEWCTTPDRTGYDLRGGSWASPRAFYNPRSPNLKPPQFSDATSGFRLAASAFNLSVFQKDPH